MFGSEVVYFITVTLSLARFTGLDAIRLRPEGPVVLCLKTTSSVFVSSLRYDSRLRDLEPCQLVILVFAYIYMSLTDSSNRAGSRWFLLFYFLSLLRPISSCDLRQRAFMHPMSTPDCFTGSPRVGPEALMLT